MPLEATNSPCWPGAAPETIGMGEFAEGAARGQWIGGGNRVGQEEENKG